MTHMLFLLLLLLPQDSPSSESTEAAHSDRHVTWLNKRQVRSFYRGVVAVDLRSGVQMLLQVGDLPAPCPVHASPLTLFPVTPALLTKASMSSKSDSSTDDNHGYSRGMDSPPPPIWQMLLSTTYISSD